MKKIFEKTRSAGFTLIELMVTITIMVIIMSVVLINYHGFGNTFGVTNLAYDMAISVRTAQTYGVAVHVNPNDASLNQFQSGYGIHFSVNNPTHYVLFADTSATGNTNDYYDPDLTPTVNMGCGSGSECVQEYTLPANYSITGICAQSSGTCTGFGTTTSLDIVFIRPNPDATICLYGGSKVCTLEQAVMITVRSADASVHSKSIVVQSSGQISVQ